MNLTVYLSGEIHSDWREQITAGVKDNNLPVTILNPITDHHASDNVGVNILGPEENAFWKDHKAAKLNSVRIRTGIERADVVVVKFGDKYRQSVDDSLSLPLRVVPEGIEAKLVRRGKVGPDTTPAVHAKLVQCAVAGDQARQMSLSSQPLRFVAVVRLGRIAEVRPSASPPRQRGLRSVRYAVQDPPALERGEMVVQLYGRVADGDEHIRFG